MPDSFDVAVFGGDRRNCFGGTKRTGTCREEFRNRGSLFSGTTGATQRGLCHGGARVRGGSCSGSGVRGSPYESWPGISARGSFGRCDDGISPRAADPNTACSGQFLPCRGVLQDCGACEGQ